MVACQADELSVVTLPVCETVENLPEDDPGEPYVPDISDDEDSDSVEDDIQEDLPWDE